MSRMDGSDLPIMQYFEYSLLPERVQPISRAVADLAWSMHDILPHGPELVAGLRKLLEAKDCFVRSAMS